MKAVSESKRAVLDSVVAMIDEFRDRWSREMGRRPALLRTVANDLVMYDRLLDGNRVGIYRQMHEEAMDKCMTLLYGARHADQY